MQAQSTFPLPTCIRTLLTLLIVLGSSCLGYSEVYLSPRAKFFSEDTTLSKQVKDEAMIGYASKQDFENKANAKSPNLTLVRGGYIVKETYLCNSSTLVFDGGGANMVLCHDNSTVTVRNGFIDDMFVFDHSKLTVSGGLPSHIEANLNGTANIQGGKIMSLGADGNGSVFFRGGVTERLYNLGHGVVQMSGGNVQSNLSTSVHSKTTLRGGIINQDLTASMYGTVEYQGGVVKRRLVVEDSAVIEIVGMGLRAKLVSENYQVCLDGDVLPKSFRRYVLSGKLGDGTSLNGKTLLMGIYDAPKVFFVDSKTRQKRFAFQ